jgi:hypothetical protein
MNYQSTVKRESETCPGVRFEILRPSLGKRAEITARVRQLLAELEYRAAGQTMEDRLAAAELESRIDALYIDWGLVRVENLRIDGEECTARLLIDKGPEELAREIAAAIRSECGLSGEERKN